MYKDYLQINEKNRQNCYAYVMLEKDMQMTNKHMQTLSSMCINIFKWK